MATPGADLPAGLSVRVLEATDLVGGRVQHLCHHAQFTDIHGDSIEGVRSGLGVFHYNIIDPLITRSNSTYRPVRAKKHPL